MVVIFNTCYMFYLNMTAIKSVMTLIRIRNKQPWSDAPKTRTNKNHLLALINILTKHFLKYLCLVRHISRKLKNSYCTLTNSRNRSLIIIIHRSFICLTIFASQLFTKFAHKTNQITRDQTKNWTEQTFLTLKHKIWSKWKNARLL